MEYAQQLQFMRQLQSLQQQQQQFHQTLGIAQVPINSIPEVSDFSGGQQQRFPQRSDQYSVLQQNFGANLGSMSTPLTSSQDLSSYLSTFPNNQHALINLMQTSSGLVGGNGVGMAAGDKQVSHFSFNSSSAQPKNAPTQQRRAQLTFKQTNMSKKLKTMSASEVLAKSELRKRVQLRLLNRSALANQSQVQSSLQTSSYQQNQLNQLNQQEQVRLQQTASPLLHSVNLTASPKRLGKNLASLKHKSQASAVVRALELSNPVSQNYSDLADLDNDEGHSMGERRFLKSPSALISLPLPATPLQVVPSVQEMFSNHIKRNSFDGLRFPSQTDLNSPVSNSALELVSSPNHRFSFMDIFSPSGNNSATTLEAYLSQQRGSNQFLQSPLYDR